MHSALNLIGLVAVMALLMASGLCLWCLKSMPMTNADLNGVVRGLRVFCLCFFVGYGVLLLLDMLHAMETLSTPAYSLWRKALIRPIHASGAGYLLWAMLKGSTWRQTS